MEKISNMRKACVVIEYLCTIAEPDYNSSKQFIDMIYRFVHSALQQDCNGSCDHPDWNKELNEMYEAIKNHN